MSRKLLKSGLIVSVMTLISRVLGLVRDVVVARLMGDGAAADVFFFANKIPIYCIYSHTMGISILHSNNLTNSKLVTNYSFYCKSCI